MNFTEITEDPWTKTMFKNDQIFLEILCIALFTVWCHPLVPELETDLLGQTAVPPEEDPSLPQPQQQQ